MSKTDYPSTIGRVHPCQRDRRIRLRRIMLPVAALILASCGEARDVASHGELIPAKSFDQQIAVPVMNDLTGAMTTSISATVFVPEHFEGDSYPLILQAHGGLGRREPTNRAGGEHVLDPGSYDFLMGDWVDELQDAGFAVISFSARGYNEENGTPGSEGRTQRISQDYEIPDMMGLIDWGLANLDIARDPAGDPLIGAMGGSDGGQRSLAIAAADPRVDAIAAAITYQSQQFLYPNDVLHKGWIDIFCALFDSIGRMVMSDAVIEFCATASKNETSRFKEELTATAIETFDNNGFVHYVRRHLDPLDGYRLPKFDALIIHGQQDTLMDPGVAFDNFALLSSLGGDVRIHTNQRGHYIGAPVQNVPPLGVYDCGPYETQALTIAWFQAKLQGDTAALTGVPRICISLSDDDWVVLPAIPEADGTQISVLEQVLIGPGQNNFIDNPAGLATFVPANVPLPPGAWLVAGAPVAEVTVESSIPGVEAVAFLGIGIRDVAGNLRQLDAQVTPIRSSAGAVSLKLKGISEGLRDGDELGVLLWSAYDAYENASHTNYAVNAYTISGTVDIPVTLRPD